jgi:hypothetical protein
MVVVSATSILAGGSLDALLFVKERHLIPGLTVLGVRAEYLMITKNRLIAGLAPTRSLGLSASVHAALQQALQSS